MLPSKELEELSERFDICLSGKVTPEGCDIRYRQMYWLMVFDAKGELRAASQLSKELTKGKQSGLSVPEALVAAVEAGLAEEHSLEALEQRYVEARGSDDAYKALCDKVDAMAGVGQMRVSSFLKSSAPKTKDPALSIARGILVDASACSHQVINHAAFAALRRSIEGFVFAHPSHPSCKDLIEPLGKVALKYTFDLTRKCDVIADKWKSRKHDSELVDESLGKLAAQLLSLRDAEIAVAEERLSKLKLGDYGALRLQARLGRAEATLAGLDAGKSFGVMKPIHSEWRVEATSKLQD